ncbi:related to Cytochrome P450 8B1 [Ustilago trichophora]|uniref:Related to Cytochrome P450 8B1 n=1 Tax=Ustilago trichophora TaxID=86804 RepID=A0A5C3EMI3_9BASI|nr:related to Cytochrome P450 8B1 [Ustilago trichophora]
MLEINLTGGQSVLLTAALAFLCALLLTRRNKTRSTLSRTIPPAPLVDPIKCPDLGNFRDNWLSRRNNYGSVHRVLEPHGMYTTYIGDALTIKDVIDHPDRFDMSTLHTGSAPMWHMSRSAGEWFAHTGGAATVRHSSHLLSGSRLASLQQRFVQAAARQLDAIQTGKKEDLCQVVSEGFFQATVEALFTKSFPKGQYQEFVLWDAELNAFCMGMQSERAVQARDHFYKIALQQIDESLSDCSLQVREQLNELESKYGLSHEDAVAVVLRTAWLGSTQSPLSGAWMMSILSRQPHNVVRIRNELQELKQSLGKDTEQIAANPDLLKGENLPTLDNMVQELLRVYSAQSVPRMCLKDTVVRMLGPNNSVKEMQLKQGDILQIMFWNVHDSRLNQAWWPEEEGKGIKWQGALETFDETRFEEARRPGTVKVAGETLRTWTPFGYGARVCPGRYWAVAEIKAFVLLFLDRFDVSDAGEMPRPDPQRWLGVLHAMDAMPATISARS